MVALLPCLLSMCLLQVQRGAAEHTELPFCQLCALITPVCNPRKTSDVLPVREVRDSMLPGPAGDIPIRIYSPAPADAGAQAGVVYFHGGAFQN